MPAACLEQLRSPRFSGIAARAYQPPHPVPLRLETLKTDRHSAYAEPKKVLLRDPERSVLKVREHRKRAKVPFAGRQGLKGDRS